MAPRIFDQLTSSRGTRSFYEELRNRDDEVDIDEEAGLNVDEENFRHNFHDLDTEGLTAADSRITVDSAPYIPQARTAPGASRTRNSRRQATKWSSNDEEVDNDVPASLLVEPNDANARPPTTPYQASRQSRSSPQHPSGPSTAPARAEWEASIGQHMPHNTRLFDRAPAWPRSLMSGVRSGSPRERAMWRWVNTTNLDSFMRDVYDYFQGGGLWCILCANALWLL